MLRYPTAVIFVLTVAGLVAAAPVPVTPPDNGPSAKALGEAVAALDKVEVNSKNLSRIWWTVADLRRRLDDPKGTVNALKIAQHVSCTSEQTGSNALRPIGEVYGRLGDVTAVIDLAASVPGVGRSHDKQQETILQEAAVAAAKAGRAPEAEKIAATIVDPEMKTWIKGVIVQQSAVYRAKTGDVAGALRAVGELPVAADKVHALVGRDYLNLGYDNFSAQIEGGIASIQLAAGDKAGAKENALKALALLPDVEPKRRSYAALAVVRMLARMDDLPAARKALAQIPAAEPQVVGKEDDRMRLLAELISKGYLAAAEVRAGRDEVALAMAGDFPLPGDRAYLFHFVALAQARAGRQDASKTNFARAVELVMKHQGQPGTHIRNIIYAQFRAGDFDAAATTAEAASEVIWFDVGYFKAKAGDFAAAKEIALTHINPQEDRWSSDGLCQQIAQFQAKAEQVAAVKEWAAKTDDQLLKAYILVGLAEGLYREGGKVTPK